MDKKTLYERRRVKPGIDQQRAELQAELAEREKDDRIIVRIPKRMRTILEELARKDRRNLSDYVRLLLENHIIGGRS